MMQRSNRSVPALRATSKFFRIKNKTSREHAMIVFDGWSMWVMI
jgi:hypothetical protein